MAMTDVEITMSGAHDLKNVNWKHGDLCAYAVAWIDDGCRPPTKVTTRVDTSGDTKPCWGQKLTLAVAKEKLEDARLVVEIYHDEAGDREKAKIVGRASLAVLEMVDAGGYNEAQDYTLKLKRPSGRPQGKLEIVVRLRERRGGAGYGGAPAPAGYGGAPPPAGSYGGPAGYYSETREWQTTSGYSAPYPAQPYAQNYLPPSGYPSNNYPSYGGAPTSYGASAPAAASYGVAPPPPQPYGAPPPNNYYNQPPPQNATAAAAQKGSKFGGIGTGLAIGALAGAVGGIALDEFVDHKEDEAAEEQAEEDAERYDAARDDGYGGGGGDDYGYGDDDY